MSELTAKRSAVKQAAACVVPGVSHRSRALCLAGDRGGGSAAAPAIEADCPGAALGRPGCSAYRGAVVPVIDLSALTFGTPAQARTSTRLVLVHYRPDETAQAQLLGLILEQATDTVRCNPARFQPYGLDNPQAPYLGPVREDAQGLLQWVRVADLLDDQVRALLYPTPPLDPALLEQRQ